MIRMKRVENSMRNMRYGLASQVVSGVLKFVLRTVLVKFMGDAIVGLNGLFTDVLAMLSIAELGVGSAITYSLYKPLAQRDFAHVARIMALFKRAYQLIALFMFLVGMALMPWIHLLVKKVDFDLSYIRLVYVMFLVSTASSYLFSYKATLLSADQMIYKTTRIRMYGESVIIAVKILILVVMRNFIVFLAVDIVGRVATNMLISAAANSSYPFLREKAALPDKAERASIFKNVANVFVGKVSGMLTSSTDGVLISVMDSTLLVGLYSNYAMIINNGYRVFTQFTLATTGSIGNLMATESSERCYAFLKRITMLVFVFASIICSGLYVGLSPFVGLWLSADHILEPIIVCVMLLNLLLMSLREPLWQFTGVTGLFKENRNISIMGMLVNLVVSILLGLKLGMLGILIGTTATMGVQYVLKTILICKKKFGVSPVGFLLYTLGFFAVTAGCAAGCNALMSLLPIANVWLKLIVNVCLTVLITLAVDVAVYWRTPEMKYVYTLVKEKAGKLLRRKKA